MEVSMLVIGKMTLWAFFLGIGAGVFYDIIRITRVMIGVRYDTLKRQTDFLYSKKYPLIGMLPRKESKFKNGLTTVIIAAGDIFFFTVMGVAVSIFLYYTNDGIFRWQVAAFSLLGFFCYYMTFGKLVISFAEILCIFLKIITKILLFTIAFPFKIMYNIIVKVSKVIFGIPFGFVLLGVYKRITSHNTKKITTLSSKGFIESFLKGQEKQNGLG